MFANLVTRGRALAALALASALLTSSCAGTAASTQASTPASLDGSTFTMGVPIAEGGVSPYKTMADAYVKAFPNRKVKVNELPNDGFAQALRTQLQAGNADDLIYVTPGSGNPLSLLPFAKAGFLEPVTDAKSLATIPASSKPLFYVDGKAYGQALDLGVVGTVANLTALEKAGIAFPKTDAAIIPACQAATAKNASLLVLAGKLPPNTGLATMVIAGSRVYADTPDWNEQRAAKKVTFAGSQGWKDTLQLFIDLQKAGCFQKGVEGGDFNAITNNLGRGTSFAAFIPGSGTILAKAAPGQTTHVQPFPGKTPEQTRVLASVNNALAITAKAKNKDAAKAFLAWLAEPAQLKAYAAVSSNLPAGLDPSSTLAPEYAAVADYLKSGKIVPLPNSTWENPEVYTALGTGIQGLFTGQTTVDNVLKSMDQAWG